MNVNRNIITVTLAGTVVTGLLGSAILAKNERLGNGADSLPASGTAPATRPAAIHQASAAVPDPQCVGGESDSLVRVANLVYADARTSRCFSDHFLIQADTDSAISTHRRFHVVKLGSDQLFNFPLAIMTGEDDFTLLDHERDNLRQYVKRGGLLLASAGCSSREWDRAFRREMAGVFPDHPLKRVDMNHPVFHMVYDIPELQASQGRANPLESIQIAGHTGVLYSQDGLNDSSHATGCCCCSGNEIVNAIEVNVNVLAYALNY